MEYLEGRAYAVVEGLVMTGVVPLAPAVRVLADALAGLHYAHSLTDLTGKSLGIVHRDVSPHNIFVTYDGTVKVLDFGIAKAADAGSHTKEGTVKGKVRYMAPEQICGDGIDRRADLFAVGILLWRALTKTRLWEGVDEIAIMHKLVGGEPIPAPITIDPSIPPKLNEACVKALAHDPNDRFQTAAEFREALEEYLHTVSGESSSRALADVMEKNFGAFRADFARAVDAQLLSLEKLSPGDNQLSLSGLQRGPVYTSRDEAGTLTGVPPSRSSAKLRFEGDGPWRSTGAQTLIAPSLDLYVDGPKRKRNYTVAALSIALAIAIGTVVWPRMRGGASETVSVGAPPPPTAVAPTPFPTPVVSATALGASEPTLPPPPRPASTATPGRRAGASNAGPKAQPSLGSPTSVASPPRADTKADTKSERDVDCSSPYYLDARGVKKVKQECLLPRRTLRRATMNVSQSGS
jgi:serine/threonine protein kinase